MSSMTSISRDGVEAALVGVWREGSGLAERQRLGWVGLIPFRVVHSSLKGRLGHEIAPREKTMHIDTNESTGTAFVDVPCHHVVRPLSLSTKHARRQHCLVVKCELEPYLEMNVQDFVDCG